MSLFQIRLIFVVAAITDILFGLGLLVAGPAIFEWAGIPAPNHWGSIQFAALMLMIFGLMFAAVAYDPVSQRNLIRYGLLLKLSYCGLVGYYCVISIVPSLFRICAIADAIFYVLFLVSYLKLGKRNLV
ncbi:MAG: hypothetical protein WCH39_24400 [Schlesneria sp.]